MSCSPTSWTRFLSAMPSSAFPAPMPTGNGTSAGLSPRREKDETFPAAAPVDHDHDQSLSPCSK